MVKFHSFVVCLTVGLGFPGYVFLKTRWLRDAGKLVAGLPLTSLFEWYSSDVPYFEAVHMLRKALLILFTTVFLTPITQGLASFAVNAVFLLILYVKDPLVYYPSSFFKGRNLFFLVEMLSTCTSLVGNSLAIVGAAVSSPAAVTSIGVVFALVNISFGVLFFFGFASDTTMKVKSVTPVLQGFNEVEGGSRSQMLAGGVLKVETEWDVHLALTAGLVEGSKGRKKMGVDLGLLRSKLELQVQDALVAMDEEEHAVNSSDPVAF